MNFNVESNVERRLTSIKSRGGEVIDISFMKYCSKKGRGSK